MRILYLKVRKPYFDLIKAGIKKEDYRDITPFWKRRLMETRRPVKFKEFDAVHIQNGYTPDRPWVLLKFTETTVRKPRAQWAPGFPCDRYTFAVGFGEVIESNY